MKQIEDVEVIVSDLAGFAKYANINFETCFKNLDALAKRVTKLESKNRHLALGVLFLAGALYLTKNKVVNLELKVKNLETVSTWDKKEEDSLK